MPIPPAFAHVPRCPPPLPLLEPSQSRLPLTSCCQTQRTLQWPWALAYHCNGDLSLLLGFLESGCLSDAPSQAHVGPPPPAVAPKCPLNGGVGQCSVPPPHPCGSCQHCANCTATHRSSQDVCDEPQTAWMYLFECLLPLAKTPPHQMEPPRFCPQGSTPHMPAIPERPTHHPAAQAWPRPCSLVSPATPFAQRGLPGLEFCKDLLAVPCPQPWVSVGIPPQPLGPSSPLPTGPSGCWVLGAVGMLCVGSQ